MKVKLSNNCLSLTGLLCRDTGYYLRQKGKTFFSQRIRTKVPPDGHWRFIVLCAELAHNGLYISDISVTREELKKALYEAHCFRTMQFLRLDTYDARDILNLKTTFGL